MTSRSAYEASERLASWRDEYRRIADKMADEGEGGSLGPCVIRRHAEDLSAVLDDLAIQRAEACRLRDLIASLNVCADHAEFSPTLAARLIREIVDKAKPKGGDA